MKDWLIDNQSQGITYTQVSITVNEPKTIKVIFIDVNPPIAKIRVSKDRVLPGEEIIFDASDSQDNVGIAEVQWDFGDGGYAKSIRVSHKYNEPGTYMIKLVVRDQAGNVAQETVIIVVEAPFPWIYVLSASVAVSVGAVATVYYIVKRRKRHEGRN